MVGPEAPLVDGIVDHFSSEGLACFGPTAAAAQLEGSKAFTKDFLARHHIPTGAYETFTDAEAACAYIRAQGAPIVVKADGLAAGKGVIVASSVDQAEEAARDMLSGNAFGDAGARVVIEEFLDGEEASLLSWSTALMCLRWQRRRTTNELVRATPALTPEAWGLFPSARSNPRDPRPCDVGDHLPDSPRHAR